MCFLFSEFVYVTVNSQGFEDKKNKRTLAGRARAYIKVNGKEYSPKKRGFNVVVINRKTGEISLVLLVKITTVQPMAHCLFVTYPLKYSYIQQY